MSYVKGVRLIGIDLCGITSEPIFSHPIPDELDFSRPHFAEKKTQLNQEWRYPMPLCVKCNREVCNPCIRAPLGESQWREIIVAEDAHLRRRSYFLRMAIATRALMEELELSRRAFPNWLADVIYPYDGPILYPGGKPFIINDTSVDDAFGDDGSFRWLSGFINFADTPPRQAPQWRVLDRLRLVDLAFKIARPDTARHFGR